MISPFQGLMEQLFIFYFKCPEKKFPTKAQSLYLNQMRTANCDCILRLPTANYPLPTSYSFPLIYFVSTLPELYPLFLPLNAHKIFHRSETLVHIRRHPNIQLFLK